MFMWKKNGLKTCPTKDTTREDEIHPGQVGSIGNTFGNIGTNILQFFLTPNWSTSEVVDDHTEQSVLEKSLLHSGNLT